LAGLIWHGLKAQIMRNRIRKIAAGAAITLGTAHLIYGFIVFKSLTPDHIWFAGAGIAMICVGFANWQRPAQIQNMLMTAYMIPMAIILPLPQVFVGLVIFMTLIISGLAKPNHA